LAETPVQFGVGHSWTSVHPDRIWESKFVNRWPFLSISNQVQPINLSSWHSTLNSWSSRYRWRRKPNVDLPNMSFANRTMSSASCVVSFAICISLPLPSLVSSFSQTTPFSFIYLFFIFLPPSFPFLFCSLHCSFSQMCQRFNWLLLWSNKRSFICVSFNKFILKARSLRFTSLNAYFPTHKTHRGFFRWKFKKNND